MFVMVEQVEREGVGVDLIGQSEEKLIKKNVHVMPSHISYIYVNYIFQLEG